MEDVSYVKFLAALVLVLALVALAGMLLKRFGSGFARTFSREDAQLGLVEILPLDNRRRLLLVRRGEVGHLLLLGANGEQVIETGIPLNGSAKETIPPKPKGPKVKIDARQRGEAQ